MPQDETEGSRAGDTGDTISGSNAGDERKADDEKALHLTDRLIRKLSTSARSARSSEWWIRALRDLGALLEADEYHRSNKRPSGSREERARLQTLVSGQRDAHEKLLDEIEKEAVRRADLREKLEEQKKEAADLRFAVEKLKEPPASYGFFVSRSNNPEHIIVNSGGREYEVPFHSDLKVDDLGPGQKLLLDGAMTAVRIRPTHSVGEMVSIIEVLSDGRLIVKAREGEERVIRVAEALSSERLRVGDNLLVDPTSQYAFEILPKTEVEEVVLEEVPQVSYEQIGGLQNQIEQIKDSVELPYIYGHLFKLFNLKPPKGILLYGPPGCGKTLIAKAVAYNLSTRVTRYLEENCEALEIYKILGEEKEPAEEAVSRFYKLRSRVYEYQSLYEKYARQGEDSTYDDLDRSGLLGNFLMRTGGHFGYNEWLDLLVELTERGFGSLDDRKVGELLEQKRRKYLEKKKDVGDREYMRAWLEEYFNHNGFDPANLDEDLQRCRSVVGSGVESYFLNIKGPELLNKYVGETEHRIREVFLKAKEKASMGLPVIVFFDEMESMFRTRGSGISSDIESTIVPQFLAEIDGVEGLDNVIVIGASNRQDLIDPAVLRPGRLDVKIRINRPDEEAATDIFSKYLLPDLPLAEDELESSDGDREKHVAEMIKKAVEEMYSTKKENEFLKVRYRSGSEEILYFRDFASGAMIEAVVSRTKKRALKRMVITGQKGIRRDDLMQAIRGEYKENEDLPNTTNPDDWARISGRHGEMIVSVETLMERDDEKKRESEEIAVSSRYL